LERTELIDVKCTDDFKKDFVAGSPQGPDHGHNAIGSLRVDRATYEPNNYALANASASMRLKETRSHRWRQFDHDRVVIAQGCELSGHPTTEDDMAFRQVLESIRSTRSVTVVNANNVG
jgi:hypothetical protein